jgi:hypothetical protein
MIQPFVDGAFLCCHCASSFTEDSTLPNFPVFCQSNCGMWVLCPHGPLWSVAHVGSTRMQRVPVAGGTKPDLWPSEEKLPSAQAGSGRARVRLGTEDALKAALQGFGFTGRLNTAFIERVNLTVRHGVAALARRTWATAQQSPHLLAHMEWWRAYYHFVRPHQSLRMVLVQPRERGGRLPAQRYRQRTPAMAAGRTTRRWTVREVLVCPLPPVST